MNNNAVDYGAAAVFFGVILLGYNSLLTRNSPRLRRGLRLTVPIGMVSLIGGLVAVVAGLA